MSKKNISQNHVHKYKKVNLSRTKGEEYFVYKCIKPTCSHYVPINLAEGKMCECNRCGEPMVITRQTLTNSGNKPMVRPHCANCTKSRKQENVEALAEFISGTKA